MVMLHRFFLFFAVAATIVVGGCTTSGGGSTPPANDVIKQVQDAVKSACAFVPTAQTILTIFNVGGFGTYADLAATICKAVNTVSIRRGGGKPVIKLNGKIIVIDGKRVAR